MATTIGRMRTASTFAARLVDFLRRREAPVVVDLRTTRQRDGDEGEMLARRHLEAQGLRFVDRNLRYRDGELDLVMRDDGGANGVPVIVFVEVRRRAGSSHGGALASVTSGKRRRLVAAATRYLGSLGLRTPPPCRFDLVTIDGDVVLSVAWHRDAFRADVRGDSR